MVKLLLRSLWHLPRNSLIGVIWAYQQTLSPDHGPLRHLHSYGYCRHEPTCSVYTQKALRERGAVVGILLGLRRVLSCHPFRKPDDAKIRSVIAKL